MTVAPLATDSPLCGLVRMTSSLGTSLLASVSTLATSPACRMVNWAVATGLPMTSGTVTVGTLLWESR